MRRRDFIGSLAGALVLPRIAFAQAPAVAPPDAWPHFRATQSLAGVSSSTVPNAPIRSAFTSGRRLRKVTAARAYAVRSKPFTSPRTYSGSAILFTPSNHLFLMCPPEYFTVAYIINPWMHGNLRRIDNAVAKQQWRSLYDAVADLATVRLVLPQPGSPDMVFTANAGLVKGRRFIVSRFRYPERQYEEPYFADWFMDRGYEVSLMPRDVPFEADTGVVTADAIVSPCPWRPLSAWGAPCSARRS